LHGGGTEINSLTHPNPEISKIWNFWKGVNKSMNFPEMTQTEKKIKSFQGVQTQPSPLPSEKAATTRNASTTILNIYLNISKYSYLLFIFCFGLLLKRCELLLLFLRGGVKAAFGPPEKI